MNSYKNSRVGMRILATTLVVMFVAVGYQFLGLTSGDSTAHAFASTPTPMATASSPAAATPVDDFSGAVRRVAEKVRPAVVQITNEQTQVDVFNQPFSVPAGVGSGVIYDSQGHILTNNHVVDSAENLLVSLPDGRSFKAKLIGQDP